MILCLRKQILVFGAKLSCLATDSPVALPSVSFHSGLPCHRCRNVRIHCATFPEARQSLMTVALELALELDFDFSFS